MLSIYLLIATPAATERHSEILCHAPDEVWPGCGGCGCFVLGAFCYPERDDDQSGDVFSSRTGKQSRFAMCVLDID